SSTIIDYKIHKEGKKNYFKIIRADDRFKKEKLVDDMDNILFRTLKTMFEHHVEDTIWKYQQGLAKTSNTLHNAIIEAGGKDHPPMLAPGNYVQWKSKIKRYINTKPNHELIHYCLKNPPYKYQWADNTVPVSKGSIETTTERNKGKAIVNSPPTIYDQEPSMVAKDDEMSKDKEIDKLMALISLSFKKIYNLINKNLQTSSNASRANQDNSLRISRGTGYDNQRIGNVDGARETVGTTVMQKYRIQCYNCKEFRHVAREYQKPKRVKDAAYHKEKMLLCKQEEAGFQLNAEQANWRDDTYDEPKDQELEAHYMFMAQIQEQSKSVNDTYPIEQDEHNMIIDSLDMSYDREQIDQNDDDDDLANECDMLASLIEKLKCEIDDSKNHNKLLETSNKVLVDKLKGLNHNLFSVGQFCDADLEVAFRKSTCYIRDLKGNDLLTVVSKSSDVIAADATNQRQQQHITLSTSTTVVVDTPLLNIQTTPETTSQAPTQAPTITANKSIIQAETHKEYAQVDKDEYQHL
nr:integrase, catalytic region, zinc finger, CCHC-type, peptidase aspartic, catalytic [Tanacetum cinerariifolium]